MYLSIVYLYPKDLHVKCLAHVLHNVCEEVNFPIVDRVITEMKKHF